MSKIFCKGRSTAFYSVSGLVSGLIVLLIFTSQPGTKMAIARRLLSLGDSYTIGETVLPSENFPNQTIQLLQQANFKFEKADVIAETGWTTDELQTAIKQNNPNQSYEFVTLLIGVNNQYRGRPVEEYKLQFESLLKQAIQFAYGKADYVIVLSIPDWGVTPFAKASGRDTQQISREIDAYNLANKEIATNYKVNYIDITTGSREALNDLGLVAPDGLHPSAKEYGRWAIRVSEVIRSRLN